MQRNRLFSSTRDLRRLITSQILKEHVFNKCLIFEKWRNKTKKIGCNNISLWLDNNKFKIKYKLMMIIK